MWIKQRIDDELEEKCATSWHPRNIWAWNSMLWSLSDLDAILRTRRCQRPCPQHSLSRMDPWALEMITLTSCCATHHRRWSKYYCYHCSYDYHYVLLALLSLSLLSLSLLSSLLLLSWLLLLYIMYVCTRCIKERNPPTSPICHRNTTWPVDPDDPTNHLQVLPRRFCQERVDN